MNEITPASIGRSVPRPNAPKLMQGRATYTDDVVVPRMIHAAFLRSPYAHARITRIDVTAAREAPGVIRVFTAADIAEVCDPWVATLEHLKGIKSAPQHPKLLLCTTWQGEPHIAVVAESRAAAEDGVAALEVSFEPLPAQTYTKPGKSSLIAFKSLRRLGPGAPNPVCYESSGESLPRIFKKDGVWGQWPQPPEPIPLLCRSFRPMVSSLASAAMFRWIPLSSSICGIHRATP